MEVTKKESAALVENIRNLMKNMNLTREEAMVVLGIEEEKEQLVRKMIK